MRPFVFCKARAVGKMHAPKHRLSSEIVRRAYPWIRLLFCPGSCTPVGQPMDAGAFAKLKVLLRAWLLLTMGNGSGHAAHGCGGETFSMPFGKAERRHTEPSNLKPCPVYLLILACLACAHTLTVTSLCTYS